MQSAMIALALATSATALVARDAPCCFGITANGGPGGSVGQLGDGQNRIGQGLQGAKYCLADGGLTDGNGRGCILTPPTTQFQCDVGASPTGGFAVNSNGQLTHAGSPDFVACPTGDNGGYNIYTTGPSGQQACVPVTLNADSCKAPAPAPAPAPSSSPAPAPAPSSSPAPAPAPSSSPALSAPSSAQAPAPNPTASSCPTNLGGSYQFPHLIVPVDSSAPDSAKGTSYNGEVSRSVSSIFNFDIPAAYAGKQCSLVFLLPDHSQLQTSSYTLAGSGAIAFAALAGVASQATTARNAPAVAADYGVTSVAPGGAYSVASFACPAGQAVSYEARAVGDTALSYFQDYNPSPIGLYITAC